MDGWMEMYDDEMMTMREDWRDMVKRMFYVFEADSAGLGLGLEVG